MKQNIKLFISDCTQLELENLKDRFMLYCYYWSGVKYSNTREFVFENWLEETPLVVLKTFKNQKVVINKKDLRIK